MQGQPHPSSFRDPSGFVFTQSGQFYRQVNQSFADDYQAFIQSGLYDWLVKERKLVAHEEIRENLTGSSDWFITLKPEELPFISYPYEWSFAMLKDAALLTLELALKALEYGMFLKDATPYNVQFYQGRMVFIDTLSFERYRAGEPWIAYRQFCEMFLAPLALMHYHQLPLQGLLLAHPNGIPLLYAKKLLPFKSRLNIYLHLHIHLHASLGNKRQETTTKPALAKTKLVSLLRSLQLLVNSFRFDGFQNIWGDYYEEAEKRPGYLEEKKALVAEWVNNISTIKTVIDLGGNTGEFSALVAEGKDYVICTDGEHHAVDQLYKKCKGDGGQNIIPLCIDLTAPTPATGVNNREHESLSQRVQVDLVMALAVVHHLSIGRNIPFAHIADMCAAMGRLLLIEFVDKSDEKVQVLLQHKKDIYSGYAEDAFIQTFGQRFRVLQQRRLSSSPRTLYLMERL